MGDKHPHDEDALADGVFRRLRKRLLIWYLLSLLMSAIVGGSLAWREANLRELSNARVAEYRRVVAEKLAELHQLDLQVASRRTRLDTPCRDALTRQDAVAALTELTGSAPEPSLVEALLEKAASFNACGLAQVQNVFRDREKMAAVDAVFQLVLKRPAGEIGKFIYGHWLQSGMEVDAVARDLMASPEFKSRQKTGDWLPKALDEIQAQGLSEYRQLVAERLEELHKLDLEEVARRTRRARDCAAPLPRADVTALLESQLGWAPQEVEVDQLIAKAKEFGLCDMPAIQRVYADRESMAAIETLYRVLLRRSSDPFGRLIYGFWWANGIPVEAAARDIMTSSEFQKLRKLGEP